jgi:transposase-like protein
LNPKQVAVLAAIRQGANIEAAAQSAGVNIHSLRRWLSTGRKNPDGRYGNFAALVDRIKEFPRGPEEHARAFILALSAFMLSASDEDGRNLQAVVRAFPPGRENQIMGDLAKHFLIAVMRQTEPDADPHAAIDLAIEEMFEVVDGVHEIRERREAAA